MSAFDFSRNQRGALGGIEGVAFGVLIFAMGSFVMLSAWAVVHAKVGTQSAARELVRAVVKGDPEVNLNAEDLARKILAERNVASRDLVVTLTPTGAPQRCDFIEARVRVTVPRVSLPLLGQPGGFQTVSATHRSRMDPYRSGVGGASTC